MSMLGCTVGESFMKLSILMKDVHQKYIDPVIRLRFIFEIDNAEELETHSNNMMADISFISDSPGIKSCPPISMANPRISSSPSFSSQSTRGTPGLPRFESLIMSQFLHAFVYIDPDDADSIFSLHFVNFFVVEFREIDFDGDGQLSTK